MYNDPDMEPGVCPHCGATSEDFIDIHEEQWADEFDWECHQCGELLTDDDIVTSKEWGRERAEDDKLAAYEEEER